MSALWTPETITEGQRSAQPPTSPRARNDYRRAARWWELEAHRGYPSSSDALRYAATMRWAAELAGLYGPGSFAELVRKARAGEET